MRAQAARIGYRRSQFREAYVVHAALDDGMLDAEQFGDLRLHCESLLNGW
jgi:hypothetical protein